MQLEKKTAGPDFLLRVSGQIQSNYNEDYSSVRDSATFELKKIGEKTVTPQLMAKLLVCIRSNNVYNLEFATEMLYGLSEKLATWDMLATVYQWLRDKNEFVRGAAAFVLDKMGTKAVTPEMLATLTQKLQSKSWSDRDAAAFALGKWYENGGIRLFEASDASRVAAYCDMLATGKILFPSKTFRLLQRNAGQSWKRRRRSFLPGAENWKRKRRWQ